MNTTPKIKCPKCEEEISLDNALTNEIQKKIKVRKVGSRIILEDWKK